MIIPWLPPLAQNELYSLRDVFAEGSDAKLQAWITRQAQRPPTKGRSFVTSLALVVAENLRRAVPQADFFHARLEHAGRADAMCARLVTATMNDDRETVDALAATCEGWSAAERRDVIAALVALLVRVVP